MPGSLPNFEPAPAPLPEGVKEAAKLLRKYAEEAGPCDHAANVCVCGILRTADALEVFFTAQARRLAEVEAELAESTEKNREHIRKVRAIQALLSPRLERFYGLLSRADAAFSRGRTEAGRAVMRELFDALAQGYAVRELLEVHALLKAWETGGEA